MIDFNYYKNTFGGTIDEDTIMPLLKRAEDIVLCTIIGNAGNAVNDGNNDTVKKAICVEAEFYCKSGTEGYSSVKIGDFSMSLDKADTEKTEGYLCRQASAILEYGGFFYRGGMV